MSEQNKAAFRAIPEKLINLGNFDTADQYFAHDYVDHALPAGLPAGVAGFQAFFTHAAHGLPRPAIHRRGCGGGRGESGGTGDGAWDDEGGFPGDEGNRQDGDLDGNPYRSFAAGKVVEHWATIDQLGMLHQLGFATTPEQQVVAPGGIEN